MADRLVRFAICAADFADRRHRPPIRSGGVRLHNDLDAAILLVAERLVELRPFLQRRLMGDDEGRVDFAAFVLRL